MSTAAGAESAAPTANPLLRVVRGEPTPEELAALVAVLAASAAGASGAADKPAGLSEWAAPERSMRTPVFPGPPMYWWASSLPR
jgi:hypothetical protein